MENDRFRLAIRSHISTSASVVCRFRSSGITCARGNNSLTLGWVCFKFTFASYHVCQIPHACRNRLNHCGRLKNGYNKLCRMCDAPTLKKRSTRVAFIIARLPLQCAGFSFRLVAISICFRRPLLRSSFWSPHFVLAHAHSPDRKLRSTNSKNQ